MHTRTHNMEHVFVQPSTSSRLTPVGNIGRLLSGCNNIWHIRSEENATFFLLRTCECLCVQICIDWITDGLRIEFELFACMRNEIQMKDRTDWYTLIFNIAFVCVNVCICVCAYLSLLSSVFLFVLLFLVFYHRCWVDFLFTSLAVCSSRVVLRIHFWIDTHIHSQQFHDLNKFALSLSLCKA